MNKELIPIEELIKEIENNKYIDCDEVDKYEEIYEYESILYYLKKYIRLNNIINYICQVFDNGSFEDGCDCIKIYDYLKELKEEGNKNVNV